MWPSPEPSRRASLSDPGTYLEVLKPDRCPLCFLVHGYVQEHLRTLLEESVTDPNSRKALAESRGFCRSHAWQAVQQRQLLGMSILYGDLLEKGLRNLPTKPSFWKKKTPAACPLCLSGEKRDQAVLQDFVLCWNRSEPLRTAFQEQGILCLSHLEKALALKMKASDRKKLREMGAKALEQLIKDLNEFLQKQDYHRIQETQGPEQDAWIRAVRMISGERE